MRYKVQSVRAAGIDTVGREVLFGVGEERGVLAVIEDGHVDISEGSLEALYPHAEPLEIASKLVDLQSLLTPEKPKRVSRKKSAVLDDGDSRDGQPPTTIL